MTQRKSDEQNVHNGPLTVGEDSVVTRTGCRALSQSGTRAPSTGPIEEVTASAVPAAC